MSCKIFIQRESGSIHVATLKDKKAAEAYWSRSRTIYRDRNGYIPEPIYVETGKGNNHGK